MAGGTPTYPVSTIAKLLLLSDRRVQQLTNEGVIPKAERGRYELAPAVQGYIRFLQDRYVKPDGTKETHDFHVEKARLTKAQADIAELEAAELRGEMIYAEHVIEAWTRMIGSARARLLSLPTKSAPRARAAATDEEAATLIEAEILEALEELASDGLPDRTRARRTRGATGAETAAEADGEPVGGRVPPPEPRKRGRTRKVAD